jgi:hypothetical protein
MGLGDGGTSWGSGPESIAANLSEERASPDGRDHGDPLPIRPEPDWGSLLMYTAVMAVPFALVAWLMS